jgi:two-component system, OmpR family, sensor histidine kinase VicK
MELDHNNNNVYWIPTSTPSSFSIDRKGSKIVPREQDGIRVVHGEENVMYTILQFLSRTDKVDSCYDYRAPSMIMEVEAYRKLLLHIKERGIKLRFLTDINKDNIIYCKELMKFAEEVRHLEGVKASFSISEKEYIATATLHGAQSTPQLVYSNVKDMVEQQQYLFNSLWNRSMLAEQRIKEIEEGIEAEFFEVIDTKRIGQILIDLVKSVTNEMLLLLPNDRAMIRINRLGVIDHLVKKSKENCTTIKIICPLTATNSSIVKLINDNAPDIKILNGNNSQHGIYIVDGMKFLRIELVRPEAESVTEAVGFAFYSNNERSADLFRWMFELLWNERTLNEELRKIDNMQKEFVNIAAHELRTPAQSIVGYTELLLTDPDYMRVEKKEGFLDAIYRNSLRLARLTKDILDVARIENQSLELHKQRYSLSDMISIAIQDTLRQRHEEITRVGANNNNKPKKISLSFKSLSSTGKVQRCKDDNAATDIFVVVDREKMMQVLTNLLDNAFKFTTENDTLSVMVEEQESENNNDKEVIVSIKDTGIGIDPQMMSRLFTKFCTKSLSGAGRTGTGLGLYISKSIVEAHGGRIWAQNNAQENGATFAFSLPLSS